MQTLTTLIPDLETDLSICDPGGIEVMRVFPESVMLVHGTSRIRYDVPSAVEAREFLALIAKSIGRNVGDFTASPIL